MKSRESQGWQDSLFLHGHDFQDTNTFLWCEQESGAEVIVSKGRKTEQLRNRQTSGAKEHAQWAVEI